MRIVHKAAALPSTHRTARQTGLVARKWPAKPARRAGGLLPALRICIWLLGFAFCCAASQARAAVREQYLSLAVPITDASGTTSSYAVQLTLHADAARAPRPRPLAVVLHGRAPDAGGRLALGRAQFPATVKWLTQRGYTVAVPTRVGYGITGGPDLEASGTCYRRTYAPGLNAATTQALAVINTLRQRPDVARTGTVLIGHSYGGIVALATAARQPAGIAAVINVSGGAGGDPQQRPAQPCSVPELGQQLRQYGSTSRTPTLWLYASNDRFFGTAAPQQWLNAYRQTGGVAQFADVGPRGVDGHTLFTHFPTVWQAQAAPFLDKITRPAQ